MFSHFLKASTVTNDIIVLVILFIIFCIYTFYFGKSRMVSLILAFYPARFFFEHFPYMSKLMVLHGDNLILLNKVLIFLLFLIPLDIIIGRYIFSDSGGDSTGHFFRIVGYSLCAVILVLIFSYSVVSLDSIYKFTPTIDKLFSQEYIFWWIVGPFGILFFL